ncbi:MMPL family transporter [Rhodococcus sp. X156]|uniref:MMPL family transporter n=1 Tax=Rhodococcus sp. X156 TaxID=2499145 RepID=UPI000FDBF9AB|nr:MMPL family transporter [Rhodococcus sp. X156]
MANYLYRLGKLAYRRKGRVIGAWVFLLVLLGGTASTLSGPTVDTFSIPGTPATEAQELLKERFPSAGADDLINTPTERFIFAAPAGQTLSSPQNQAAMDKVVADLKTISQAKSPDTLVNPVVAAAALVQAAEGAGKSPEDAAALSPLSPDGTVGYLSMSFTGAITDITPETRDQLKAAAELGRSEGLTVEMTGTAAAEQAGGQAAELIGLAVAAVVLTITFGSLVAAGLPLLMAIIGIAVGSLAITTASGFFDLNSATPTLAIMIGLAVAVDYSLFILSRYRNEVGKVGDREEAAGRAVGTAGSAVVFAGLTVIIALVALRVVNIPFMATMGYAAAFTVAIAVVLALTLLPAILGLLGEKAFAGRIKGITDHDAEENKDLVTNGLRWARLVRRVPVLTLVAGVVLLGVLAIPAANLELALPNDSTADPDTTERKASDLVTGAFGAGVNGPLIVVVDASQATVPKAEAFAQVVATIKAQGDVANAQVLAVNPAGDTAQLTVIPSSSPSSTATHDLVSHIRDAEGGLNRTTGVSIGVTGQTAIEGDVSERLSSSLVPYLAVVIGLAFLLLMLVFRSILVPLTATLGFLLSVLATFGATVAIFQEGALGLIANPQPIVSMMPIFLIGVVFGLAMDYQVFLVTRMREEYVHGATPKDAVTSGFHHGARVVTAAAIIMMSVFGSFMLGDNAFIKSIGFALAAAVLFDAFVVRMVIIPAVMTLLGSAAWWLPRWLDRILPNVDVEGEQILKQLDARDTRQHSDPEEPVAVS